MKGTRRTKARWTKTGAIEHTSSMRLPSWSSGKLAGLLVTFAPSFAATTLKYSLLMWPFSWSTGGGSFVRGPLSCCVILSAVANCQDQSVGHSRARVVVYYCRTYTRVHAQFQVLLVTSSNRGVSISLGCSRRSDSSDRGRQRQGNR